MKVSDVDRINDWIVRRGFEGADEVDLLRSFCEKCNAAGLPLSRSLVIMDTLHPVHEGTVFRWRNDDVVEEPIAQYGRTTDGAALAQSWQRSPFYYLLQNGGEEMRWRIGFGETADFPVVQDMQRDGHTDYVVFVHRFASGAAIGEMDGVYSGWSTRSATGFDDDHVAALRRLVPALGLAVLLGAAMGSRSLLLRWPARALTMTLQSSPIVLTLVIAAAIAHSLFTLSTTVVLGAAIAALGLANGSNAGQAIAEAMGSLRAEGVSGPGLFGQALRRAATQIVAFLINASKGTPIASFIGAPELLSSLTDITSFSSGRATTYTILLIFYTLVVMVVVWLCGRFQRYLERRQVPA